MSGGIGIPLLSFESKEAEDSDKFGPMHLTTIGDHESGANAYLRKSEVTEAGVAAFKFVLTPVKTLIEVAEEESVCPDEVPVVCCVVEVECSVVEKVKSVVERPGTVSLQSMGYSVYEAP